MLPVTRLPELFLANFQLPLRHHRRLICITTFLGFTVTAYI